MQWLPLLSIPIGLLALFFTWRNWLRGKRQERLSKEVKLSIVGTVANYREPFILPYPIACLNLPKMQIDIRNESAFSIDVKMLAVFIPQTGMDTHLIFNPRDDKTIIAPKAVASYEITVPYRKIPEVIARDRIAAYMRINCDVIARNCRCVKRLAEQATDRPLQLFAVLYNNDFKHRYVIAEGATAYEVMNKLTDEIEQEGDLESQLIGLLETLDEKKAEVEATLAKSSK